MVKVIKAQDAVSLESFGSDVKLIVKGQKVTVIGPRGTLKVWGGRAAAGGKSHRQSV